MELDRKTGKAFKDLKEKLIKKPVLVVSELDKKMRMKVNMLDYTIERVLSIECEDG